MIRLQRVGRRNDPSFRVVATEKQNSTKSGKYLEMVGSYDARTDRKAFDAERIRHWLSKGAKASATVHNLLVSEKIIEGKKINILPKNKNRAKTDTMTEVAEVKEAVPVETAAPLENNQS